MQSSRQTYKSRSTVSKISYANRLESYLVTMASPNDSTTNEKTEPLVFTNWIGDDESAYTGSHDDESKYDLPEQRSNHQSNGRSRWVSLFDELDRLRCSTGVDLRIQFNQFTDLTISVEFNNESLLRSIRTVHQFKISVASTGQVDISFQSDRYLNCATTSLVT